MKCHVCGSKMQSIITDLPFKVNCVFRPIPDTDSGPFRTLIPIHSGHSFRPIPDTLLGAFRHPISIK